MAAVCSFSENVQLTKFNFKFCPFIACVIKVKNGKENEKKGPHWGSTKKRVLIGVRQKEAFIGVR